MILPTAAISVAALLSAAMLFGSFPNGGLGLPHNYHVGQRAPPTNTTSSRLDYRLDCKVIFDARCMNVIFSKIFTHATPLVVKM